MKMQRNLRGMEKVIKNLHKEIKAIKGRSMKGLILASIIVRRDMEDTSPKVPVDYGNLRSSWFVVTSTGSIESGASPKFEGPNANELSAAHADAVSSAKALARLRNEPVLVMGFGANYAIWVHENVGGTFARPGSGAKFFEAALKRNEKQMLEIIRLNAKIQ